MHPWAAPIRSLRDAIWLRRPAVPVALAFILGILAHRAVWHAPFFWLTLFALFTSIATVLAYHHRSRLTSASSVETRFRDLCLPPVFLFGLTLSQFQEFHYSPNHIGSYATDEPTPTELDLRIDTPPRLVLSTAKFRPLPPRQVTTATVLRIKADGQWIDANGKLLVQIDQPHPRLELGQQVRVIGLLQRPLRAMNPGQFDWAAYYAQQRILASLTIKKAADISITSSGGAGLLDRLREHARHALGMGFSEEHAVDHALLRALVLGDHDGEMREVQEQFARSGTAYQLAISGMHVAILAGAVFLICRLLCCGPRCSVLVMMLFVIAYGLVALPATPILRAAFLCLSIGLGVLLRRPCDKIQLLALAAIGVLVCQPLDLYSAGFQLSFVTVLGMMVFARPVLGLFHASGDTDDRIALAFLQLGPGERAWVALRRHALASLGFATIAWLVSAPLIAFHFDQLNPWVLPAGLLMFPIVMVALMAGMLKIVLTMLLPGFAGAWAGMSRLPVALMRHSVALLAKAPGSHLSMPRPSVAFIVAYYALLCLPLLPFARPTVRRCLRFAPALACMLALLPLLVGIAPPRASERDLRVTLLAIGAGQVGVVELPSGGVVLIDDGSSTLSDPVRSCLAPFLREEGKRSVSRIFLSHPDFDHVSGTVETVEDWGTREVDVSPVFREQSRGNAAAELILETLDAEGRLVRTLSRGDRQALDESTQLEVIWPPPHRAFAKTNEAGLVLRLTCRGKSILFPADIQQLTEGELLANASVLKSDVLVAPHHGSAEATTADFVTAVAPELIVASNDRTLSQKQLRFDQIVADYPLYRTNRFGAVTVTVSPVGKLGIETFLAPSKRLPDCTRWKR